MKHAPVEGESTTGRTRRFPRAAEALAATLSQEATQSFEAPANRGVRTRVKTNTDTQSGMPRPGMLPAGIRPGAELKSNEMGGIAAGDARLEMCEPEEGPARPSIRRETRLELGRAAGPELLRVPLRRDPVPSETRNIGRPRGPVAWPPTDGVADVGETRGEHAQWGWIAAMVLAIAALSVSIYVAFGR